MCNACMVMFDNHAMALFYHQLSPNDKLEAEYLKTMPTVMVDLFWVSWKMIDITQEDVSLQISAARGVFPLLRYEVMAFDTIHSLTNTSLEEAVSGSRFVSEASIETDLLVPISRFALNKHSSSSVRCDAASHIVVIAEKFGHRDWARRFEKAANY